MTLPRLRGLLIGVLVIILLMTGAPVRAADPGPEQDLALARRYAPVFYFHSDEIFRPQPVDVIVTRARLRQSRRLWFDVNVLLDLTVFDFLDLDSDPRYFLDVWYGDDGGSAYADYSAHQAYYQAMLSPEAGGPPTTVYAHVVRSPDGGTTVVQYWALYFYNDWFNKHEGDWEMVQVMLDRAGDPQSVVLSQHHGGTRRAWRQTQVEEGTHPAVYVALGSHANYFVGDEIYPNGVDIGNRRIEILDRTGRVGRVVPQVVLLPDREVLTSAVDDWPGAEWLPFRGHWGELAAQGDFGGPLGPPDKGPQWETPATWGLSQPHDLDVWYENRLRVEILGLDPRRGSVRLRAQDGTSLPELETLGNVALLHADPPASLDLVAELEAPAGERYDVVATWPDAAAGTVQRFLFEAVPFGETGRVQLALNAEGAQVRYGCDLTVECLSSMVPAQVETDAATWDAPDLVWMGTLLPAHRVSLGFLVAVGSCLLPTLAYVGALYWVDRYEKEPKRLLAATFLWGAIPAVLLSVFVELFFRLPPTWIDERVLEAVRLGFVTPLVEETTKGLAVLFIAFRYRREFDNVLDGVIYGAMVGFGFAMTSNLIGYLSGFALRGFSALGVGPFFAGVVQALNSALYTSLFGASLGLARLSRERWRRRLFPLGGFVLAVGAHTLHSLLAVRILGLSPLSVALTGVGVSVLVVAVVMSLRRQRAVLSAELRDEIPEGLYRVVCAPRSRARAQWKALRGGGLGTWMRTRRLHQLCAELAFKKMQHRLHPHDAGLEAELEALRQKMETLLDGR